MSIREDHSPTSDNYIPQLLHVEHDPSTESKISEEDSPSKARKNSQAFDHPPPSYPAPPPPIIWETKNKRVDLFILHSTTVIVWTEINNIEKLYYLSPPTPCSANNLIFLLSSHVTDINENQTFQLILQKHKTNYRLVKAQEDIHKVISRYNIQGNSKYRFLFKPLPQEEIENLQNKRVSNFTRSIAKELSKNHNALINNDVKSEETSLVKIFINPGVYKTMKIDENSKCRDIVDKLIYKCHLSKFNTTKEYQLFIYNNDGSSRGFFHLFHSFFVGVPLSSISSFYHSLPQIYL